MMEQPHSTEAEIEVLATALLYPGQMPWLATQVKAADFWVGRHEALWSVLVECQSRHGVVDDALVMQTAKDVGQWERMGGASGLSAALDRTGLSSNAERHVQVLKDKALQRRVLDASNTLATLAIDDDIDVDQRLAKVDATVRAVFRDVAAQGLEHGSQGTHEHAEQVRAAQAGDTPPGIQTGIWALDQEIGGLRPGWHVLVMAKTGVGKSAFAINNLALATARTGMAVAVYSLEMTRSQVMGRLVAAESGVPYHVQMRGKMSTKDLDAVESSLPAVAQLPIYIDEGEGLTVDSLSSRTRALSYEHSGQLGMVILDYIQLMEAEPSSKQWKNNRTEEIAKITRTAKKLAKELNCVVVTLSQPTAEGARNDRDLSLADAKGAQSIGADVDMAIILNKRADGSVVLDVAKFRHGPPFRLANGQVRWNGARMAFQDLGL